MIDVDNYKKLFINTKIRVNKFYLIITIFIILFIIILTNSIYYENIYQENGIGTKEGYIKTIINKEDINKIMSNSNIIINDKSYKYKIVKVSELLELGDNFYQEIYIKINKNIQENEYISFKVQMEKIKFYKLIINKVRGKV